MNIGCIALDLDRTLLNEKGRLSAQNRRALEAAISRGVEVVAASGRALSTLPEELLKIPGIRYAITSNGAAIYQLEGSRCLRQYKLTAQSVLEILACTREEPVAYEGFVEGKAYAQAEYVEDPVRFGASPQATAYVQGTRIPIRDITAFLREHAHCMDSIDVVVDGQEKKRQLWELLERRVKDIYITSSVQQLIEISYKDAGKHTGLKFLSEYLKIPLEEIAAFGDGDNDAQMLREAGVGIAMENATDSCKQSADYVTKSNREDGVAYGIAHFLGITF